MNEEKRRRGRPKNKETQLDSQIILECAKKLFLLENKIPSIRKIAAELSIDPMSIYYYYPNKNSLLEAITISLMDEIYKPKDTTFCKKELELLCKSYLSLLENYPGLLEVMLGMTSQSPANLFIERLKTILNSLKLDNKSFNTAVALLVDYLHGVAFAIQYNSTKELNIDEINEPLKLYIKAIENF